jgi:hypothetical protein
LSVPGCPCRRLSVCSPPPLPVAVGVQEGAVDEGEYHCGPRRKAGLVVQHPQDRLRRRALVVAVPPSIVVFVVSGEGEEVPCPPSPYPPSFSSSPSRQPRWPWRQGSKVEARPQTQVTSQQPQMHQKGAVFYMEMTGEGGEEGLHGMEGRGKGAAMMMNSYHYCSRCHQRNQPKMQKIGKIDVCNFFCYFFVSLVPEAVPNFLKRNSFQ